MKTARFLPLLFALICSANAAGQVYLEKQSSHRFAQLTLGAEAQWMPAGGSALGGTASFPHQLFPKIHIGGTHFWGHAEFYVSFPVGRLGSERLNSNRTFTYNPGIETGAKIYPWRLEAGKLRPYVGAAYALWDFRSTGPEGSGALNSRSYAPLQLGVTYQRGAHLINLGLSAQLPTGDEYYFDPSFVSDLELSPVSIQLGWKYQLETTLSAEYQQESGYTKQLKEYFEAENVLSAFSIALGPSSTFIVGNRHSNFNDDRPWLDQHIATQLFLEGGLGYYYAPWDAHINLSLRQNQSQQRAFGAKQSIRRRAITLECYKFLFDYHGFAPFIGPSLSRDFLRMEESRPGNNGHQSFTTQQWNPGITFGWDIRPNQVQSLILRTNLRYTPIRWDVNGERQLVYDQLEFNFIQLVWYPSRWVKIRNRPSFD